MHQRRYYEAYDDRYRQVHDLNLQWFSDETSAIVDQVMTQFGVNPGSPMLEIGCGEGRDALPLLRRGCRLLATDVSAEAIAYCRRRAPEFADSFRVVDCLQDRLDARFDFIYAVAVVHMLVSDADRAGFYRFIREHLSDSGIALICTMGDGTVERSSDISTAFDLQERTHDETGRTLHIAGTSCRMVRFPTFEAELAQGGLEILQQGVTCIETLFPSMMYAVVRKQPDPLRPRENSSECIPSEVTSMNIQQLDTPCLILDRTAFDRNRQTLQQLMLDTGMQLRPHYKSHHCPAIAKLQLEDGAKGVTCAKLGEAEDLAAAGVHDILIANQIVQPEKLPRVAALADVCRLTLCVDSAENVRALEQAMAVGNGVLYCLVEYDVGMKRCGVETHDEVIALAGLIRSMPHLRFEGVQAYAGQMSHEVSLSVRQSATEAIEADLRALKARLEAAGLPAREISGGSTGMIEQKPRGSIYTEMQCGSYLFMDQCYNQLGLRFSNALYLLTTVISVKPDRIVTDGGTKSLGMDQGNPVFVGFEDCDVRMSEEHGQVCAPGHHCRINDKIRYIPGHCCTTMNTHDRIYVVEGDRVIDVWPITSRGKSY